MPAAMSTSEIASSTNPITWPGKAVSGTPVVGNRIGFSLAIYNGGFKGVPFGISQLVV